MCGIAGLWARRPGEQYAGELERMANAIVHRGPDDRGLWFDGRIGLANQRLSIIDIEGGHQPFVSDDGQIVVVQNGEIFNFVELGQQLEAAGITCRTRSDTEILLRMYEHHGIDMLEHLNGMFAIAILDQRKGQLLLARDRAGIKPLFWQEDGNALRFASEIKSILRCNVPREVDHDGLHQYLTFNYVPPPGTIFKGIRHVPPGHFARVTNDGISFHRWWRLDVASHSSSYRSHWEDEFRDLLRVAVDIRMRADVPFGAFLSGGVDSSAVVATMAERSNQPVRSFCIGFEDQRFDESAFAQALADRVGASHRTEIVEADMLSIWPRVTYFNDQPHGDVSFMPTYRVASLAAEEVKLVLTGDGGDELFAGYDKYKTFFHDHPDAVDTRTVFETEYPRQLQLFSQAELERLYAAPMRPRLQRTISDQLQTILGDCDATDGINLALYIDFMWLLPGNNLVKPDRMAMANSLEARSPFLDYRMMEWSFALPGSAKLRDGETKYVMKAAVSDLIGPELAYRRKQMFTVPIGEWLKSRAQGLATRVLFDGRTQERGLFDPTAVRRLYDQHQAGTANHTRELRALIALELWFRTFIDTLCEAPPTWQELGLAQEDRQ